jgi:hypothetical protein
MKKTVLMIFAVTFMFGGLLFIGINTYANDDSQLEAVPVVLETDSEGNYSIEDMLVYALLDEIHARDTYIAMIEVYGEIKPLTHIMDAEQRHIDLLLPLFETYQIELPVSDYVPVVPQTIEEVMLLGQQAEIANIALYESFLTQELPDDIKEVFTSLVEASNHHLEAFSKDRLYSNGQMGLNKQQKNQNNNKQNCNQ